MLRVNPDNTESLSELNDLEAWKEERFKIEETPEWAVENLEYDLRTTDWVLEKARADEAYAQHIYAALCNNRFMKNEVWPTLLGKTWTISWRAAGGLVANMLQTGDYTEWYCSGIFNDDEITELELAELPIRDRELRLKQQARVAEGVVTHEIRADFLTLGWTILED